MHLPSTHQNNLKVLRGYAYFAPRNDDGTYRSEIPMSPSAELTVALESEEATYVSAEEGVNEILDRTLTSLDRSATLACNNLSREVLGLFIIAGLEDIAQASASVTNEDSDYVFPNSRIQLGGTANNGAGVFGVSAVSVSAYEGETAAVWTLTTAHAIGDVRVPTVANTHWYMATTAGTTAGTQPTWPTNGSTVVDGTVTWQDMGVIAYTFTTDYETDLDLGSILIPSTGAIAIAVSRVPASLRALGRTFRLRTDYTRAAKTIERIATKSTANVSGKFRFQEVNPKGGNGRWFAPSASLAPNGELALKSGTDYGAAGFTITFQKPATGSALYRDGNPA